PPRRGWWREPSARGPPSARGRPSAPGRPAGRGGAAGGGRAAFGAPRPAPPPPPPGPGGPPPAPPPPRPRAPGPRPPARDTVPPRALEGPASRRLGGSYDRPTRLPEREQPAARVPGRSALPEGGDQRGQVVHLDHVDPPLDQPRRLRERVALAADRQPGRVQL